MNILYSIVLMGLLNAACLFIGYKIGKKDEAKERKRVYGFDEANIYE